MKPFVKSLSSFFLEKPFSSPSFFWGFFTLLLLPFFLCVVHFIYIYNQTEELSNRIQFLEQRYHRKEHQMKKEEAILDKIRHSQMGYLENVLGSLVFLSAEKQKWQLFSQQIEPSHPMKERVSFLENGSNTLEFIQSDLRKNALFQESEEKQKNAVEMNEEDLKTLLCYIEGSPIHPHIPQKNAPHLLIKSFKLEKKMIPGIMEKNYLVHMQLIKREALSS